MLIVVDSAGRATTIDDRGEAGAHLVLALRDHLARWREQCRLQGLDPAVPPDLAALLATLAANRGHPVPQLGDDDEPRQPLAVTYQTAAALLDCSARTIRRRVAAGVLPTTRVGGRPLVPMAALVEVAS